MKPLLFSVFFVAALVAQGPGAPRVGPVPESQWTGEQRAIAAQFASSGMTNAIATYLHYPTLAQSLLAHERYISNESTLPPRHRLLLAFAHGVADAVGLPVGASCGRGRVAPASRPRRSEANRAGRPRARWPDAFEATAAPRGRRTGSGRLHLRRIVGCVDRRDVEPRYDINQIDRHWWTPSGRSTIACRVHQLDGRAARARHDRSGGRQTFPIEPRRRARTSGSSAESRAFHSAEGLDAGTAEAVQSRRHRSAQTANVFQTFVRNPPADRMRRRHQQSRQQPFHALATAARTAADAHRRAVSLRYE